MSDGDALLAAIAAAPGDRGARLAYADWLAEHADPARGVLLGLLAREPESLCRAERRELSRLRAAVPLCDPAAVGPALKAVAAAATGAERAAACAALVPLVPADHPARPGLVRLAARYAAWVLDHPAPRAVWGGGGGYDVRPYRDGGRAWVCDLGNGQQCPGAWATWADAALWGLACRGQQREFHGVALRLAA